MAINEFKEIVDRRGYLVEPEDRKIFEKEIRKANFGMGYSDMIEFILYDSNDNQLPQGENGEMVRYISIDDANFNDYFLISDNNLTKKKNDIPEFLIDLQRLIREAGYSSGVFKTQVTLLNRRVGSEKPSNDKLWIHEISPSRTEIRLLPLKKGTQDLKLRYDIFTNDGNFRDDTIYYAIPFIENLNVEKIFESFLRSKGRINEGKQYANLIKSEFKVDDIELLFKRIRDRYIQSMKYFIQGKVWNINDRSYGKPAPLQDRIELSLVTIRITALQALTNAIEYYLPRRDIRERTGLTEREQRTFDRVKEILKSASSNQEFPSTIPSTIEAVVRGCMDPKAKNYNADAKEDDGSCKYGKRDIDPIEQDEVEVEIISPPPPIKGCTDRRALNYNPKAEKDDGSCQYKQKPQQRTKTYYIWSGRGAILYQQVGVKRSLRGNEYDSFKVTYDVNTVSFIGDVREVPKPRPPKLVVWSYTITNNTFNSVKRSFFKKSIAAYRKPIERISLSDRPKPFYKGQSLSVPYRDKLGKSTQTSIIEPGESVVVCAVEGSIAALPGFEIIKNGACSVKIDPPPKKIQGCTDPEAINYNRLAVIENGTCKYKIKIAPVLGCTDRNAKNFNPLATKDNGTCIYKKAEEDEEIIIDDDDDNVIDPGPKLCVDPKAENFRLPGPCKYPKPVPEPIDTIIKDYLPPVITEPVINTPTTPRGGGGGGGGSFREDVVELDRNDFSLGGGGINPFTNRGDFVLRRVPNRNIR